MVYEALPIDVLEADPIAQNIVTEEYCQLLFVTANLMNYVRRPPYRASHTAHDDPIVARFDDRIDHVLRVTHFRRKEPSRDSRHRSGGSHG